MKTKESNKGFTLIELVIVIAIIGILAGLAIPRFLNYLEESRKNVCIANRAEMEREYAYNNAKGLATDLKIFLDDSTMHNPAVCPSQGTYSIGDNDHILCSYHDADLIAGNDPYGNNSFAGAGAYTSGTTYAKGTKVVGSDGIVYESVDASNTAGADPATSKSSWAWKAVGTSNSKAIEIPDSGSYSRYYEVGVIVKYKGEYYKSTSSTKKSSAPSKQQNSGWELLS
jgi:prepilin-type N-terminal cleavage/methylation domain-containing protein